MANYSETIVIDMGSYSCKAGFAGQDTPHFVFPTILGQLKRPTKPGISEIYVGDKALRKLNLIALKHPIEKGIITDWNDMENLWYYTFNDQLRINPEDHSIFIAESALAPKEQREKTAEIMFESFKTPSIGIATNAILSMHSLQRKTGVVVDSGDTMTQIVPVHDG